MLDIAAMSRIVNETHTLVMASNDEVALIGSQLEQLIAQSQNSYGASMIKLQARIAQLEAAEQRCLFAEATTRYHSVELSIMGGDITVSAPRNIEKSFNIRCDDMEARLNSKFVESGGTIFQSLEEARELCVRHIPGNHFGYFYDIISMITSMCGVSAVPKDLWEEDHHTKRGGYKSTLEANMAASF